jgi:hypothetical protein
LICARWARKALGRPGACAWLAALLALSSLGPARAEGVAGLPEGEFLFASPPDGWVLGYRAKRGDTTIFEYVPAGETVQNWTEIVTVQVWQGARPSWDPEKFVAHIAGTFQRACQTFRASPPSVRQIGGYDNASVAVECRDPDRSQAPSQVMLKKIEFLVVRVIRGKDGFYVVQRAWHSDTEQPDSPMSLERKTKEWGAYMLRVEVCDTRDPALVCGSLGLLSAAGADALARQQGWTESGGCLYLRMLTVVPDVSKPIGAPVVVAAALGQGPFVKSDAAVGQTVNTLAQAVAENRPATVIAKVSSAAAVSPAEDAVKAETDVAALRDLLVERGVAVSRVVIRPNPSCR